MNASYLHCFRSEEQFIKLNFKNQRKRLTNIQFSHFNVRIHVHFVGSKGQYFYTRLWTVNLYFLFDVCECARLYASRVFACNIIRVYWDYLFIYNK